MPGIGYKPAVRIVKAHSGKMMYPTKIEEDYITRNSLNAGEKLPKEIINLRYRQLSLFDDVRFRENFYESSYENHICV